MPRVARSKDAALAPGVARCPFSIVIDTREQRPYTFMDISDPPTKERPEGLRIAVNTVRAKLNHGDYGILGYPRIAIERKSKEDLYGTIAGRREAFRAHLAMMSADSGLYDYAAVMVEAEHSELLTLPPAHCRYPPLSLNRTIVAWRQRYIGVDWWFEPNREWAEVMVFRMLQRYYNDRVNTIGAASCRPKTQR